MAVSQKCLYGLLWSTWAVSALLSIAYATMAFLVLQGLYDWIYNAGIGRVINISGRISGVTGSCAILVIVLAVYIALSFYVLISKVFRKKDSLDYQYGCLVGATFCMIFITLQTALVLQSSQYLVAGQGQVGFDTEVPLLSDDNLFNATTIVGYVTSFVYFVMFVFLVSYQCAVGCGCCLDDTPPPSAKPAAASPAAAPSPTQSKGKASAKV